MAQAGTAGTDRKGRRGDEAPTRIAYRVLDLRCKGLTLRVAPDGGKTWNLSFRIKGAGVRRLSLGRFDDVDLEAARQRANEITSAARQGRDLIADEGAAREEHKQSFTVERLIGEYLRRRVTGRLRTAREIEQTLKRALAGVMTRKAVDIRRRDLRELLDEVADRGLERAVAGNSVPGHRRYVQMGREPRHRRRKPSRRPRLVQPRPTARSRALGGRGAAAVEMGDDSRNISIGVAAIL